MTAAQDTRTLRGYSKDTSKWKEEVKMGGGD